MPSMPQLVDMVTTEIVAPIPPPPLAFSSLFHFIHTVHSSWRWHHRIDQLHTQRDSFKKLLAGWALGLVAEQSLTVRLAARCALVANRLMQCAKQKMRFYYASIDWLAEVRQERLFLTPALPWDQLPQRRIAFLLSASVYAHLHFGLYRLYQIAERLLRVTLMLFLEMFRLSMHYLDVIEALSLSSDRQGMSELFLNCSQFFHDLQDNQEAIIKGMKRHRKAVQVLLDHFSVDMSAETVTRVATVALKGVNTFFALVHPFARGALEGIPLYARTVWASIRGTPFRDPEELQQGATRYRLQHRARHNPSLGKLAL